MSKPKKTKQAKCAKCGGTEFAAPYTEIAWQRFESITDGTLAAGADGYNVQEHNVELEHAECASCSAKINLADREVV